MKSNKNLGINEEDTPSPNNSGHREPNHSQNGSPSTGAAESNKNQYNSEFDERDQKQNIGQKGDTYPPDDPAPSDDGLDEFGDNDLNRRANTTGNLEDVSASIDPAQDNEEEQGNYDSNKQETVTSRDELSKNEDITTEMDIDDIDTSEDSIDDDSSDDELDDQNDSVF